VYIIPCTLHNNFNNFILKVNINGTLSYSTYFRVKMPRILTIAKSKKKRKDARRIPTKVFATPDTGKFHRICASGIINLRLFLLVPGGQVTKPFVRGINLQENCYIFFNFFPISFIFYKKKNSLKMIFNLI